MYIIYIYISQELPGKLQQFACGFDNFFGLGARFIGTATEGLARFQLCGERSAFAKSCAVFRGRRRTFARSGADCAADAALSQGR